LDTRRGGRRFACSETFFQDYKQLEGKQVQVDEIRPAYSAVKVIEKSLASYKEQRELLRAKDHHQWKCAILAS